MHVILKYLLSTITVLSVAPATLIAQELLTAPNKSASPINQRRAHGNSCGPASLLNAFQYGNTKWQKSYNAVAGTDSRSRINSVIKNWGNKPSKHIKGVHRWNVKQGINLLDLTDMANEMRTSSFLPKIKNETLTTKPSETKTKLLQRTHQRMVKSLTKGLPPIISIRRYAYRYSKAVGQHSWWPIRAHFVVVSEIPKSIPQKAQSFKISYIDPYGGYTRTGTISATTGQFTHSPFLIANFPQANVGKHLLKPGETSELSLSAIIGRW